MIRMVFAIMLVALVGSSYAVFHENSRGAQVHTPFRWVFANGTARIAQSVVANDTDKVAYQKSDSSMWVLRDNSPVTWICLNDNFGAIGVDSVGARAVHITGDTNFSAPCSLFDGAAYVTRQTGYFEKRGNTILITVPAFGTQTVSGADVYMRSGDNIPSSYSGFLPSPFMSGVDIMGFIFSNYVAFNSFSGNYLTAGSQAFMSISIFYRYR